MKNEIQANSYWKVRDKTIIGIGIALVTLNVLDGGLTLLGLSLKIIYEVNPLMNWLIATSPNVFMAAKFLVPLILSMLLWVKRHKLRKVYRVALMFVFALYSVAMFLHAYWIAYLLMVLKM